MIFRERQMQRLQLLRCFNKGHGQTSLNMPLDVAVEERDARIVGLEPEHRIAIPVDEDGVSAHGDVWWRSISDR